ncbi:hypothetical protein [Mesorhizobium sp. WSM2239]|uniref:Uncharacterized protein n=2 Tax=unclassified Mesorhizobium TaxID=325217 RepID=A0AAU8D5D5_9HYPH
MLVAIWTRNPTEPTAVQLRLPVAAIIFVGSYLPLSLILLAQDYNFTMLSRPICWGWIRGAPDCVLPFQNPGYSISIFAGCLLCFLTTLLALWLLPAKRTITIVEAEYIAVDLMNYTLPYVVSFMSIDYRDNGKFLGLLIFLAWMFWLTYRSGQIILNPLLIAFGWRLYNVRYRHAGSDNVHIKHALAKGILTAERPEKFAEMQDVFIIKPKQTESLP